MRKRIVTARPANTVSIVHGFLRALGRGALVASLAFVGACASVTVDDHARFTPTFSPEAFFDGSLRAHGVVKNRGGKIIRTFDATIDACWRDAAAYLVEDFIFDDGEEQRRIWTLAAQADGSYAATAGDVVGPGNLTVAGNSVFLDYVLTIPLGDGAIDVRVDDRMYLVAPDVLFNESILSKFGVRVGSLGLVILRPEGADHATARQRCLNTMTN